MPLSESDRLEKLDAAATPIQVIDALAEACRAAKREMWNDARLHWTMADFKNWAVIQQIDAALSMAVRLRAVADEKEAAPPPRALTRDEQAMLHAALLSSTKHLYPIEDAATPPASPHET